MKKVLIIGNGKLAKHLEKRFSEDDSIEVTILCRYKYKDFQPNFEKYNLEKISYEKWKENSIDFERFHREIYDIVEEKDYVINTLAITDLNECKKLGKYTYFINSLFPQLVFKHIYNNYLGKFIQISSMTVNEGNSIYAKSKRKAENNLLGYIGRKSKSVGVPHKHYKITKNEVPLGLSQERNAYLSILRTSWLYDEAPDNKFLSSVLRKVIRSVPLSGTLQKGYMTHYKDLVEYIYWSVSNDKLTNLVEKFHGNYDSKYNTRKALIELILETLKVNKTINTIGYNVLEYPDESCIDGLLNKKTFSGYVDNSKDYSHNNGIEVLKETIKVLEKQLLEEYFESFNKEKV